MVFDWSIRGDRLGLLYIHLVSLLRLCVDFDDILVLFMTVCCMTTLPLARLYVASLCWTHMYPLYLQLTSCYSLCALRPS